ncbi:proton-coupled folate transporter-like [Zerene cesonia]|uniref:proton-coupled folate transporter-like n=1 Tax=Zerene cesonia TaxID=33412 RepID=UPI0018E54A6F|nr:proton-coupled folate transporter-like [Zerene cesonia]
MEKSEVVIQKNCKPVEDLNMESINESDPLKPDNKNGKKEITAKDVSLLSRLKVIKQNITVEPIMVCYVMPSVLASLATQNLNLEKACLVNLNYSTEVCEALKARDIGNYTEYEDNVQLLTAYIQSWKNIIQTAFPVLIILFVGAWSDKTGRRKPCILLPIVGELLSCIGFMINTYFFYELPAEVTALTESVFPAITGGWYTNFIGVFSYISDITTVEDRTYRVGIANLCMSLGYPIGSAFSGILLRWIGYYGVFSISVSLYMFSLIYGFFYLDDTKLKIVENKRSGCFGFFREFFDFRLVKETFKVAFRKGPGNRRTRVCLLLFAVFVIFGPMQGEYAVMYLFARYRFNWDEVKFSMWSTYCIVTNLIGTAFSMSLFSGYFKVDDTILGIISCTSKIVASFAYGFARNDLEIYLAPLLEMLNGTSFIAMRSIATKLVTGEEFGKVNSLFGLAEAMTPLLYGPLYSRVYMSTLNVLPGAVFILGGLLTVPAIIQFGWLYFEHKKDRKRDIHKPIE